MPSRQMPAAGVAAVTVTPLHSVDQFRLHLLKQVSDGAKTRMHVQGPVDGESASALRILWERSDLPAGKFADEVAGLLRSGRFKRSTISYDPSEDHGPEVFSAGDPALASPTPGTPFDEFTLPGELDG